MVRIRKAHGWVELPLASKPPGHFERSDGSRMTQDEIGAVSKAATQEELSRASMAARFARERAEATVEAPKKPEPTPRPTKAAGYAERAWEAVARLGTQVAAAKDLGVTQGSIQRGLDKYMEGHGITGPRPGLVPTGTKRAPSAKPAAKVNRDEKELVERTRPFVEARSAAIAAADPGAVPAAEVLDELVDAKVAASAPSAPWRARLEERYVDLLLRLAESAAADDPVFDRIERLLGMVAA